MSEEISEKAKSAKEASNDTKPDFVYSLHGIRTNAYWQSRLADLIECKTGFAVGSRNYMRFDLLMFLMKGIFSHKPLGLVEGDLRDLQKRYRVSVIAHSFGTWLLLKALSANRDLRVHNVILCGAIFPRASAQWRYLKYDLGQITGQVVNFCGTRDPFPALAELISRDFGASGVVGSGDPTVKDSFHDVGHSGFLNVGFCDQNWIPILKSDPYKPQPPQRDPSAYINGILWASAHRVLLFFLLLASGLLGYKVYQSEWSCYVRSCYVDVIRIHNYSSSTRLPGPRRYVDEVAFEYTYNFDRDTAVFRAREDRHPFVTSLSGDTLDRIEPDETAEKLFIRSDNKDIRILSFPIPVRNRRASFSVQFSEDNEEAPDAIEVFADRVIRRLRLQIFLLDDVRLEPRSKEFIKSILIDGKPAEKCVANASGTNVRCENLMLPKSTSFQYCFAAKGWNAPGQIDPPKTEGCKMLARK